MNDTNRPIGKTPEFRQTWQALMQQLDRVLSVAHRTCPNRTETQEAVSVAKHLLGRVGDRLLPTDPGQPVEEPTATPQEHTPGPWHTGQGNGEGSVFADHGRMRMESGGTTLYPIATITYGWAPEEDEANARLIAAAPELLAAANSLAMALCGYPHQNAVTERALAKWRSAFTKATGKTL